MARAALGATVNRGWRLRNKLVLSSEGNSTGFVERCAGVTVCVCVCVRVFFFNPRRRGKKMMSQSWPSVDAAHADV